MPHFTERLSEGLAIIATIDPASHSTAQNSDGIDMRLFRRVIFVVAAGAIGANTLTAVIKGGNDNSTFATTLTGKTFSSGVFSGSVDNNTQGIIEVTAEECAAQDVRYIRMEATPSGAAIFGVVALAGVARYEPASDYDLASVAEIVA
jgi:hypothetical protein